MHFSREYDHFLIHTFWSEPITDLINKIKKKSGKDFTGSHDLLLEFLNNRLFHGEGEFNKEFRRKGKRYFDLKVPNKNRYGDFEIIEFKYHSSQLKYLRYELKRRNEIFTHNDYLYFSYLLRRVSKKEDKIINESVCIYYLVVIILSKNICEIPINELIEEIKMGTEDITKKVARKSDIDEEEEELLGVENIIKVVDLEQKLEDQKKSYEQVLKEREKELKERKKELKEREKELKEERKLRHTKEKEIERLKDQLNNT
ncbi:MAG: hypothetical protein GF311_06855 [Candidatus Lokiarchaeota archaeon]|nr:hypothetical protein [Candidatus Lokiarchaeota archaeon]